MFINSTYNHVCDTCASGVTWVNAQESIRLFAQYKRRAAMRGVGAFFNEGVTCWKYEAAARQLIIAMKYGGCDFLIDDIARMIKTGASHLINFARNSLLVPVPIHYFKYLSRDYNQAELIANALAKCTNSQVVKNLLTCKNHAPQMACSMGDRLLNVRGVFRCNGNAIDRDARIIIVDDVITTGATMFACCAAMHRQRFRDVNVLTLSHG